MAQQVLAAGQGGSEHNRLDLQTWSSSVPCGSPRLACQGKVCSQSTSKHGNSYDEWLQTELISVTEPKAKQNCAISLGREGPGICSTIFGLLSVVSHICVTTSDHSPKERMSLCIILPSLQTQIMYYNWVRCRCKGVQCAFL